uniref:Uncharacterized protein n=1 Tax=Arundo donax TaxID=35708 RepID=A0A0A9AWT3_ARUDO
MCINASQIKAMSIGLGSVLVLPVCGALIRKNQS